MNDRMIKLHQVEKEIKGNRVLDIQELTLQSGTIYGFYGRNGSGKTMLFRAISGLIFLDHGSIDINDKRLHEEISIPEHMGVLIENPSFFPYLTGLENLNLLASINAYITTSEIIAMMELFGMDAYSKKKVKGYSLGMKQKLGIIQALMELVILDEPTNSLDEETVRTLRSVLLDLKKQNKLILIASHNKDDLRVLADIVYGIDNGKISGELQL